MLILVGDDAQERDLSREAIAVADRRVAMRPFADDDSPIPYLKQACVAGVEPLPRLVLLDVR